MVNEKRLIDANALISNLRTFKGLGRMVAETLVRFAEKQPTVDAVEVVRCKDCESLCPGENGNHICASWGSWTDLEGWCYKGERKNDG